jgi:Recombinase
MSGNIHWRRPAYSNIYRILTNPVYGGAYPYGKTESQVHYESGLSKTRSRRRDRDHWVALIPGTHEGYVEWDKFERIQKMIRGNRFVGAEPSGAARRGIGLLGGVLSCRRCGRMLRVYYKGDEGNFVRYACSRMELDTKEARCIAFSGATVDTAVARELLRVVEPAAIEAAVLASQQQAKAHSEILEALHRDLEAANYRVLRAHRQYEAIDPENRLVARELERRWNVALQEKQALELRIAEESEATAPSSVGTLDDFQTLANDLETVWNDEHTDERTKKRLLRALIREIVVDVDEQNSEVIALIHWKGGVHTPLRLPKRRRGQSNGQTSKDIIEAVRSLARICNDQMIAGVLNRAKLLTSHGNFWSRALVTSLRHRNEIDCHDVRRQTEQGWINLSQAAQLLGTTRNTLRHAIKRGQFAAERPVACGPWILNRQSLEREGALQLIECVRSSPAHPTIADSKQCSLDLSTTY